MQTRAKIMSAFSWDSLYRVCEVVSIGAGVLTAVALIGQVIAGRALAREQAETILRMGTDLEKEKITRLELEKSLAPRQIALIGEGGKTNIDSLKPFAGMQVVLKVLPDAEASRAASNILWLLQNAGWNVASVEYDPSINTGFFDGVVIEPYKAAKKPEPPAEAPRDLRSILPTEQEYNDQRKSEDAVDAVVEFLKSNSWAARRFPGKSGELAPNTIKISVGFKPYPYFDSEESKEAKKREEEFLQRVKKFKEESQKRDEELKERMKSP